MFHETSAVLATVPPSLTAVTRAAGVALLVDDEELVRAITADMLAELGFEVVEASSGRRRWRGCGVIRASASSSPTTSCLA